MTTEPTYQVLPEYTDEHLRRQADTSEGTGYRAVCRDLLTVPADWRQSILAAAYPVPTGIGVHEEVSRLVAAFHGGNRPPRVERPLPAGDSATPTGA